MAEPTRGKSALCASELSPGLLRWWWRTGAWLSRHSGLQTPWWCRWPTAPPGTGGHQLPTYSCRDDGEVGGPCPGLTRTLVVTLPPASRQTRAAVLSSENPRWPNTPANGHAARWWPRESSGRHRLPKTSEEQHPELLRRQASLRETCHWPLLGTCECRPDRLSQETVFHHVRSLLLPPMLACWDAVGHGIKIWAGLYVPSPPTLGL